jgi:GMP synthase-like glutamine amidotransferase
MKLCILENDDLDPAAGTAYGRYGSMFERLFKDAGADWEFDIFHTPKFEYPASFDAYRAVLLTGSKADSFSDEPWIVELRARVTQLLAQKKKLLGICFGHQLIALCLGAKVGRAPQGWGVGRMSYDWHAADLPLAPEDSRPAAGTPQDGQAPMGGSDPRSGGAWERQSVALLVSHQDQVLALPDNAVLLASNAHCPVAGYAVGDAVFCVQGHPEFVEDYSAFLMHKRRERLGEHLYTQGVGSLQHGHDGLDVARMMVAFVEGR